MRSLNFPMTYKRRPMSGTAAAITVRRRAGEATRGILMIDGRAIPVALGRGGLKANKREGDGGTPIGTFRPLRLWWRKDRHVRPPTSLPVRAIRPTDGWCEDPIEPTLQSAGPSLRAESNGDRLMRTDHLYDFIVEIDHNTRPRIAGRGSAVFLHLARPGFAPTAGCIAMTRASMLRLLARLEPANADCRRLKPEVKVLQPSSCDGRRSPSRRGHASRPSGSRRGNRRSSPSTAASGRCAWRSSRSAQNAAPAHPRPAECTSGPRSSGRNPRAQAAMKASASAGAMPAFCGSSPVLICTNRRRRAALLFDLLG